MNWTQHLFSETQLLLRYIYKTHILVKVDEASEKDKQTTSR